MLRSRVSVWITWVIVAVSAILSVYNAADYLSTHWGTRPLIELIVDVVLELYLIIFSVPAALILARQPRNTIGWLLMVPAIVGTISLFTTGYLESYPTQPPPLPFLVLFLVVWFTGAGWLGLIFPLLLIPLFYPTGRLLSPRWRWAVTLALFLIGFFIFWSFFSVRYAEMNVQWVFINPNGFITDEFAQRYIFPPWVALLVTLTAASAVSIVLRYRRAQAIEREQIKWLAYACALFAAFYIPTLIYNTEQLAQPYRRIVDLIFLLVIAGIPVAITIALLRYRLFDIDVIIRLTLVYALVTGLLGLAYAGGVVLLQEAFRSLTGQASQVAVVVTTLLIAALFNPLRARIQGWIDRRFYRKKYDTEQALAEFTALARSGSDLDTLTAMLGQVVQTNLQPSHFSLRLRKFAEKERDN